MVNRMLLNNTVYYFINFNTHFITFRYNIQLYNIILSITKIIFFSKQLAI